MWIKICGITTLDAALAAVDAGADAVGFVFVRSRREIAPEAARKISECLPPCVETIGVFLDAPWEKVDEIRRHAGLTGLQLHGGEPPEYCVRFVDMGVKVIKGFRVLPRRPLREIPPAGGYDVHGYLFEPYVSGAGGGTGHEWDWNLVDEIAKAQALPRERIILAGGLTPENVMRALDGVRPGGIDVSSGVESDGRKDSRKIRQFIENVRRWEHGSFA